MACKWLVVPIAAVFLAAIVPMAAAAHAGDEIAGRVPRVLTAVSENDSRSQECTLGDAAADAVRASLGTDVAIVCGGDLVKNLLPGEVTYDRLSASFREDRPLAVAQVTVKELRGILEAGFSHITLDKTESIDPEASAYDGFPQISGFTLQYDASAPPGSRLLEIRMNKKKLDLDDDQTVLTLGATGFMLEGGYGLPAVSGAVPSELTLTEAMAWYLNQEMPDYMETGLRIYPVGAQNGSMKSYLPFGVAIVAVLLIGVGNSQRFKHMVEFRL